MKLDPENNISTRSIRNIKYVFSAIIIILLIISFFTFRSYLNYVEEVRKRVHSNNVIRALQEVEVEVLNAEIGHRGYQLTINPDYLKPYLDSKDDIVNKLSHINELVQVKGQQKKVDSLGQLITRQYAIIEEIINQIDVSNPQEYEFSDYEKNLLAFGRQNMSDIRQIIDQIEITEKQLLTENITEQESQSRFLPILFVISNVVALLIIIYVFFYIYKLLKIRTQTETELREKQIQLLEAERMVNIGNWSWNIETNEMEWSEGLYQIYNLSPLTVKPHYDIFTEYIFADDRKEVLRKIDEAVKHQTSYEASFRIVDNGNIRNVNIIGNPKIDFENNLVGYFGVTQDVTEQKNYQNQIIQQAEELKRSNEDLEQFAYVASHDLQEPLRKIRAFGDRLKTKFSDKLEGTGVDYINRMENAAERMQILINDLLTFSRVSRTNKEFVKHDLTDILEEVLEDLETKINDTEGQVKFDKLPEIVCNPSEIKRLFQNIIGNSLKFQKPGIPPLVTVKSEIVKAADLKEDFPVGGNRKFVRLIIKDNGIGFQEKYQDRIFNVFQRLHGRSQYKGTGIGLAICRKVVANHEGHIMAKGEENKGAEFIIVLPKNLKKNDERTEEVTSNIDG